MKIRLGTRGSRLARAQSSHIERLLRSAGHQIETLVIRTAGDRQKERSFDQVGEPGIFVREIEKALLEGRIDVAVHSFKDLPTASPEGLEIAAVPERIDARDLLITVEGADSGSGLLPLPEGASIGTASARRRVLLNHLRPDLSVKFLRGNVETRLGRLRDGAFDGILLASAGVRRLARQANNDPFSLVGLAVIALDPARFVPAPAQGALALQIRAHDEATRGVVSTLDDAEVHRAIRAERQLLARVEGGCSLPFGAWCQAYDSGELELVTALGAEQGLVRAQGRGSDPIELADEVWARLQLALGKST